MIKLKKLFRVVALFVVGLFPFIFNIKNFKFKNLFGVVQFFKDYFKYNRLSEEKQFSLSFLNLYPSFYDRFDSAGDVSRHYFHQDIWAAKKVFKINSQMHYDIGSRLDGFISHCLVFTQVTLLDIRPLKSDIKNLFFMQTDATNMKNIESNSISSLSSLHAIEHFGLGRYGDPVDPYAYKKAMKEMQRIVMGGVN